MRKLLCGFLCLCILLSGCSKPEQDLDTVLNETAALLLDRVPEPGYGSVGGEWTVYGMTQWGGEVPAGWFEGYEARLSAYVTACGGVLHEKKHTEYSRVVIALTAMGGNPRDVGGYDLTAPLMDYDKTAFQDITGPAWALIALDSGSYGDEGIRAQYVEYLLERELAEGGWCLMGGEPDTDLTAMALRALAPYAESDDVQAAIERGVAVLASRDFDSCESAAQTILSLTALGITPADGRFTRDGQTLKEQLLQYRTADGMFCHLVGGDGDLLATEQAFQALLALNASSE